MSVIPTVISMDEAKRKLYAHRTDEHTIFSVVFVKRSNDEVRHMNCRFNVKKYLAGGVLPYKPADYDLIGVFDMESKGYRMISLDTLMVLKMNKEEYHVQENLELAKEREVI
jgi:hypothetical protein